MPITPPQPWRGNEQAHQGQRAASTLHSTSFPWQAQNQGMRDTGNQATPAQASHDRASAGHAGPPPSQCGLSTGDTAPAPSTLTYTSASFPPLGAMQKPHRARAPGKSTCDPPPSPSVQGLGRVN
ncbi:hypothetical protein CCHR01_15603 [Colletotrichum chrysophilum]|uniref:Uncharacterized protein n=1 Tax=Colletotrichum chrysophilum TaxID=1836956 RepID=A0AAD9A7Z5_9PEZI|nr:hypothetical protein K456DRAFT_1925813 [Colletotrichum gloeosporioides 23]KAK1841762.1 hypothetical protein CCHR01_15603 [Colletotrichum chrysophilum]